MECQDGRDRHVQHAALAALEQKDLPNGRPDRDDRSMDAAGVPLVQPPPP
jgi:hypothetical protein